MKIPNLPTIANTTIEDLPPELRADLDPRTKSWVLKAQAKARSLKLIRRDVLACEKFFAANPEWTAGHLLALMKRCKRLGQVAVGWDPNGWDSLWNARMGTDFKLLLIFLRKVLVELQVTGEFPTLRDVAPEELYKPRVPRGRRRPRKG